MPLPQALTGDITDQLNAVKDASLYNEMDIRRLRNSIEKVKNADMVQYHMLYGMFHSIFGDLERSVDSHEKSLELMSHAVLFMNYGYSMKRFGHGLRSFELMKRAVDIEPTDSIFSVFIASAINCGVLTVDDTISKFDKSNPAGNVHSRGDVNYLANIRDMVRKAEIPDSDYTAAFAVVESVLAKHRYMLGMIAVDYFNFGVEPYVAVDIYLKVKSSDEIVEIQDEIAMAMADSQINCWDRIVFTICPRDDDKAA